MAAAIVVSVALFECENEIASRRRRNSFEEVTMSRRQRILLYSAAAVAAISIQPARAEARASMGICQSTIHYWGGGVEENGAYSLVLECGESLPEGGCYEGPGGYKVFDCETEQEIGVCDGFTCAHTR